MNHAKDLRTRLYPYRTHQKRKMPWRVVDESGLINPYHVMVSEIMLQQTQVDRVVPKFEAFVEAYPTVNSLADAPLREVLQHWSGLGYNRRAKYLHDSAKKIVEKGKFPSTAEELIKLPGIGKNTAGAILAYAFNQPVLFVETNIRTVYIYHFFHDQADVLDSAILELLDQTLDKKSPREFYWSLMDYGTELKKIHGNLSRKSKTYVKQSKFEGSYRQVRGKVLQELAKKALTKPQLQVSVGDKRLQSVLEDLQVEGLITKKKQHFILG